MNIDLHIHTNASDGSLSPSEVVKRAADAGLAVIAIADHDTTDGVPEAEQVQQQYGVIVIPGVEVSATHPLGEAHILGYWVDYRNPDFCAFLEKPRATRPERIAEMCGKLSAMGMDVTPEEVFAFAGDQASVGRPHLARILIKKGYVKEMDEAFDRYLGRGAPAHVKRFKNTSAETLSMIHRCGGVSVLAHPGLIDNPELISVLIHAGVMGIEAYCHDHSPEQAEHFSRLARTNGLVVTGGSDYHGDMLEKAFELGDLQVPYACYLELKEARDRLRNGRTPRPT